MIDTYTTFDKRRPNLLRRLQRLRPESHNLEKITHSLIARERLLRFSNGLLRWNRQAMGFHIVLRQISENNILIVLLITFEPFFRFENAFHRTIQKNKAHLLVYIDCVFLKKQQR